jgi:hypothetical protein
MTYQAKDLGYVEAKWLQEQSFGYLLDHLHKPFGCRYMRSSARIEANIYSLRKIRRGASTTL